MTDPEIRWLDQKEKIDRSGKFLLVFKATVTAELRFKCDSTAFQLSSSYLRRRRQ